MRYAIQDLLRERGCGPCSGVLSATTICTRVALLADANVFWKLRYGVRRAHRVGTARCDALVRRRRPALERVDGGVRDLGGRRVVRQDAVVVVAQRGQNGHRRRSESCDVEHVHIRVQPLRVLHAARDAQVVKIVAGVLRKRRSG